MAGYTKEQRAAKKAKETESKAVKPVDTTPDIKIVNVSADNDVLKKLDLQFEADNQKLKTLPPVNIPKAPSVKLANGMVQYYDTRLKVYGTELEARLNSMIKFNPDRYKKL